MDCRYLLTDEGANGHAIIQRSFAGENCIILYPGANHKITRDDMDQVLADFGEGDVLVCQNEISEMELRHIIIGRKTYSLWQIPQKIHKI